MTDRDRELMDELFRAARREAPNGATRDRIRAAVLESSEHRSSGLRAVLTSALHAPWGVKLAVAGAAAAIAVAPFVARSRHEPPISVSPEPISATPPAPALSLPSPMTWPAPSAEPSASAHPVTERAPRPELSAPRPPPSLSDEVAALDQARSVLASGDTARALSLLDAYAHSGGKRLSAEATLLRIEALSRAGRRSEARAIAQRFVAKNVGSPLADRARQLGGLEKDETKADGGTP